MPAVCQAKSNCPCISTSYHPVSGGAPFKWQCIRGQVCLPLGLVPPGFNIQAQESQLQLGKPQAVHLGVANLSSATLELKNTARVSWISSKSPKSGPPKPSNSPGQYASISILLFEALPCFWLALAITPITFPTNQTREAKNNFVASVKLYLLWKAFVLIK